LSPLPGDIYVQEAGLPAQANDGSPLDQTRKIKEARMKKRFASMAVSAGLACLFLSGLPVIASAEVNSNLDIGNRPMVADEPSEVVLIPGAGVYFIPDAGANLFYHAGFWWSSRGDRWYRSRVYNGPWVAAELHVVPVEVALAPKDNRVSKRGNGHNY
jgi:hypothetical protein